MDRNCFESLLGIDRPSFLSGYYERKPYYARKLARYSQGLIGWRDIDRIVSENRIAHPRMRLFKGGQPIPETAYTRAVGGQGYDTFRDVAPDLFRRHIQAGATLVIDAINELHGELDMIASDLEHHFGTQMQANLYAVLGSEGGFDIHWDDHDVVAVQLSGAKEWQIYSPTRVHPLRDDVGRACPPTTEPEEIVLMEPGDVLYLPRGWWHRVVSKNESVHVTYGFGKVQQLDILQIIRRRLCALPSFRQDVPSHVTHCRNLSQLKLDQLKSELMEAVQNLSVDDIWHFVDAMRRVRTHVEVSAISGSVPAFVIRNWRVKPYVSKKIGGYHVSFGGKTLTSRVDLHHLVQRLDRGVPIMVSDLCAELVSSDDDVDDSAVHSLISSLRDVCMIRGYID